MLPQILAMISNVNFHKNPNDVYRVFQAGSWTYVRTDVMTLQSLSLQLHCESA